MMEFFLYPERLWHLLWLLPVSATLFAWVSTRRRQAIQRLFGPRAGDPDITGIRVRRGVRAFRMFLLLCVMTLLVGAWARPTWGQITLPTTGAGRDIMVLFDVSRSMLATDVAPSRMRHAKALVSAVSERMKGDRFGLVAFAGNAFLECPLTFDRVSLEQILEMMDDTVIPEGGTNLERALSVGLEHLTEELQGSQAMVLITDGEEHVGQMSKMVAKLKARHIPLVTIGIGDPLSGSVIQITGTDGKKHFLTDRKGDVVKTRLNEEGLRRLAAETEGVYVHSTTTQIGDKTVADYLRKLTPVANEEQARALPIQRWPWFIGGALALFFVYMALGETAPVPNRRKIAAAMLLLMASIGTSMADEDTTRSSRETYNRGVTLHSVSSDSARLAYETALVTPPPDDEVRARANLNLGVTAHDEAREAYGRAAQVAESDLDSSLLILNDADRRLTDAEALYRNALSAVSPSELRETGRNQQMLLQDRRRVAELRKVVEELKKRMEEAQQQAESAEQQQQQANQSQDQQQKQSAQQQANQQTQSAKESAKAAKEKAQQLKNQQLEKMAESAEQSLEKAQESQEKGQPQEAEKHLKDAAEKLKQMAEKASDEKSTEEAKKQGESQQSKPDDESKEDGGKAGEESLFDDEEKDAVGGQDGAHEKIEEKAAEALLREMAQEEKAFREEILKKRGGAKIKPPEKDW